MPAALGSPINTLSKCLALAAASGWIVPNLRGRLRRGSMYPHIPIYRVVHVALGRTAGAIISKWPVAIGCHTDRLSWMAREKNPQLEVA